MTEKPKQVFKEAPPTPEPPPPAVETPQPAVEYAAMDTAPLDGTHILLNEGTREVRARWQKTRKIEKGRWVMSGKWVSAWDFATIAWEPKGWRVAPSDDEVLRADTEQARRDDLARRA
jgi:hypothetical protein